MNDKLNPLNWDISPDADKTQLEEDKKKRYEEDVDFLKAFTSPSGKKVLEWMIKYTLDSPTWWPAKPKEYGYFREGQNNLVRQIKSKIENAKTHQEKRKP